MGRSVNWWDSAAVFPSHAAVADAEHGVFRNVVDLRIAPVDRVALRLALHHIAEQIHPLLEGSFLEADGPAGLEILAEHVGREGHRAAGVFFLAQAVQVGREADLGFDFLLAVAVIVVGDHRDHHAAVVAAADLEGIPVVIEFVFAFPAHAVAALALGGVALVRQAQRGFLHRPHQVRRQNHATCVAGPVHHVERGVVFGKVRIPRIPEDRFDEVEIAHQAGRREKAYLHGFRGIGSGCGTHQGTDQQGNEQLGLLLLIGGERQCQDIRRRRQRRTEQSGERSESEPGTLSAGIGNPPSAIWKTPLVVRRSLCGLCRMPCGTR